MREVTALPPASAFSVRDVSILVGLMIPTTIALIDVGMIGVALPAIQADYAVSVALLSWVLAAGYLLRVPLMPIYGRVGDSFGKKYLYLIGLTIFISGALVAATAPSFGWLIAGRLLQGLGSAASLPLAMALIAEAFAEERRGRALGIWNASAPIGMMLGPVLGGLIVEGFGWHAVFLITAGLATASLGVIAWLVPAPARAEKRPKINWGGGLALLMTIAGLLLATTTASVVPFGSPLNLLFWAVTLVALAGLVRDITRHPAPFISAEVIGNRRFMTPAIAVAFRMFVHDGIRFLLVLYLANIFGQTPRTIGFFMLFYGIPLTIGVTYGGFLADRWPGRLVGSLAMLVLAGGTLWLALVGADAGTLLLTPGLIVAGLSGGISLTPFTKTAVAALGPERVGLAAGLYNTLRFAGIAVSTPLLGLLLARGFARYGGLETVAPPYQTAFLLLTVVAVVGAGIAALMPQDKE